jgi:S1-C subfamily serine protease
MRVAPIFVPVKVHLELDGDPALLTHMRRQSWLRLAWANCAALWLVVVAALVIATCSCARPAPARPQPPIRAPSTIGEQLSRSVSIEVACFGGDVMSQVTVSGHAGTGVIVDQGHVMTAHHVAACEDGDAPMIHVVDLAGARRRAWLDREDPEHDLARLRVDVPFFGVRPALVGPRPGLGEQICAATAWPVRIRPCGMVVGLVARQLPGNTGREFVSIDVEHTALTIAGNSGSGVWDAAGRLVCIVTHSRGSALGGHCSSLAGRAIAE